MKEVIIDQFNAGKKIFNYILMILPEVKKSDLFKMFRKKIITVNQQKVAYNYVLKEGDHLIMYLKKNHFHDNRRQKFKTINMKLDIIYEDQSVIVINKPKTLLVHADSKNYQVNLLEGVKSYLYKKKEFQPGHYFSPALCNRLDMNTSGIVVVAKKHQALKEMTGAFRNRNTVKKYRALVYGKITQKILLTSMIDARPNSLNKVTVQQLEKRLIIPDKFDFLEQNARLSATLVRPIHSLNNCTLLDIELWTGKKHQIRAQLCAANHALLGDQKYYTNQSLSFSQLSQIKQYHLHAYSLSLEKYEQWTAQPPHSFIQICKELIDYPL